MAASAVHHWVGGGESSTDVDNVPGEVRERTSAAHDGALTQERLVGYALW